MSKCVVCGTVTDGTVGNSSFSGGVPLCHICCSEWCEYVKPELKRNHGRFSGKWKSFFVGWLNKKKVDLAKVGIEQEIEKVIFT